MSFDQHPAVSYAPTLTRGLTKRDAIIRTTIGRVPNPRTLRWRGFLATALLAASAWLASSYEHRDVKWVIGVIIWYAAAALLIVTWLAVARLETSARRLLE